MCENKYLINASLCKEWEKWGGVMRVKETALYKCKFN